MLLFVTLFSRLEAANDRLNYKVEWVNKKVLTILMKRNDSLSWVWLG